MNDTGDIRRLLEEIRNAHQQQLEHQREALRLQREQFALVLQQAERAERIQTRAEQLQAGGARLVRGARLALVLLLPVIIALLVYLSWLILR